MDSTFAAHRLSRSLWCSPTGGAPSSPRPHRLARFYLGGFCAESRFAPSATRALNSRLDFERARESLGEKSHWIFLLSAVDEIIAAHWSEVDAIARALLERGTLSGDEIARLRDF